MSIERTYTRLHECPFRRVVPCGNFTRAPVSFYAVDKTGYTWYNLYKIKKEEKEEERGRGEMEKEKKRTLLRLLAVFLILTPTVTILLMMAFRGNPTPAELAACTHIRVTAEGKTARELEKGSEAHTLLCGLLSLCKEMTLEEKGGGKRYTVTADGMEATVCTTKSGHLSVKMRGEQYGIRLSPLTGGNGALAPAMLTYSYLEGDRRIESEAEVRTAAVYYAESAEELAALAFDGERTPDTVKVLIYEAGSKTPILTLDSIEAIVDQSIDVNKSYQVYVSAEILEKAYAIHYMYEFYWHTEAKAAP